jgi:hypothetical protein
MKRDQVTSIMLLQNPMTINQVRIARWTKKDIYGHYTTLTIDFVYNSATKILIETKLDLDLHVYSPRWEQKRTDGYVIVSRRPLTGLLSIFLFMFISIYAHFEHLTRLYKCPCIAITQMGLLVNIWWKDISIFFQMVPHLLILMQY